MVIEACNGENRVSLQRDSGNGSVIMVLTVVVVSRCLSGNGGEDRVVVKVVSGNWVVTWV